MKKQKSWSNFPFLSANIYNKTTGKTLFPPYEIFHRQGLRIAVVGLTTTDTAVIGNPEFLKNIEFRDPIAVSQPLLEALKTEADIIIAATHMGHYPDANYKTNAPGDIELAEKTNGYDLIVGGHSQTFACMNQESDISARECTPRLSKRHIHCSSGGVWGICRPC